MTLAEINEVVRAVYPEPVLRTWEPTEYELKYKFKNGATAKARAKLEAEKKKRDEKLRHEHRLETAARDAVFSVLDRAGRYPSETASLFWQTVKWTIDGIDRAHASYLQKLEQISEFGDAGRRLATNAAWFFRQPRYLKGASKYVLKPLVDENWNEFAEKYGRGEFVRLADGKFGYENLAEKIENWQAYVACAVDAQIAKEADPLQAGGSAYAAAIGDMTDRLAEIMDAIEKTFDGRIPDGCETDPSWGAGGRFDCVLRAGNDRVSFKSFTAGGWNIQKFHYRYRITRLVPGENS